ncbi:MAG: hypothetical protein GY859_05890, partial [Desulfobacterales bacterium]|nr:hypothetical protein [Desulfobacterales bacterium]
SGDLLPSGRPGRPAPRLEMFLRASPFPLSVLVNPVILPRPVEETAPPVVEELKRLSREFGVARATVSNLALAEKIRDALPDFHLTASTLMDISRPNQVLMLRDVFENLVPASRIARDLSALKALKEAFPGKIRLMVNEACLPACPFRTQHFFEMGSKLESPKSLCDEILEKHPWMRLTGAWIPPHLLHLYDGCYDDLKLAGRVTLRRPEDYMRALDAYVHGKELSPDQIGGGPASPRDPIKISEAFFARTLTCGKQCHRCDVCRNYYEEALKQK